MREAAKATSPIANLVQLAANFTGSVPASTTNWSNQQVFPGNTGSASFENFKGMLEAAFAVPALKARYKKHVLIGLDSGFGNAPIINYLLEEGYQFVVKLGNAPCSNKMCQSVEAEGGIRTSVTSASLA